MPGTIETRKVALPPVLRSAEIRFHGMHKESVRAGDGEGSETENAEFDVTWSTGAVVPRSSWTLGDYDEALDMSPAACDLSRMAGGVPVLTDHVPSASNVVGTTIPGTESLSGGTGTVRVRMSARPELAGFVSDVEAGIIRNVSVGYFVQAATLTERDGQNPLVTVTRWQPFEISLVAVPADSGAVVNTRDGSIATAAEIEIVRLQVDDNSTRGNLNMPTEAEIAAASAAATAAAQESATRSAVAAALTAERTRTADIRGAAAKLGIPEAAEALINDGATIEAARAALIDAAAAKQPATTQARVVGGQDETETRAAAMSDAILWKSGERDGIKLEGYAQEYAVMSLSEMARSFLAAKGVAGARTMDKTQVANAVFSRAYEATTDFPIIAGNSVSRTLRRAYTAAPRTYTPFVTETTLPDFKQVARVQTGGLPSLVLVPEGQNVPQVNLAEEAERYALATYAFTLKFTRQLLINDDLGALMRQARMTGNAAARTESDLVWGVLTSNPNMSDGHPLFCAEHGNLGTAGMVNVADVGEIERLLMNQTDPSGNPLGLGIKALAAGSGNNVLLRQITGNLLANTVGGINPYSGVTPILETRVPGNEWFGFADIDQIDIIELAHLEGQEGVQTYVAPESADFMGTAIRVSLDVGAKALDWRGVVKNAGA